MQLSFDFTKETVIESIFSQFIEREYFNFFLSFAAKNGVFITLKAPYKYLEKIFFLLNSSPKTLLLKKGDLSYLQQIKQEIIFVDLSSFFNKTIQSELAFLDVYKTLITKSSFIGIIPSEQTCEFAFLDVASRYNASIIIDINAESSFDFLTISKYFLYQNGIKVEQELLKYMMLNIERTANAISIFLEEVKCFIETTKKKVTRFNYKIIFENYEKRKNSSDF